MPSWSLVKSGCCMQLTVIRRRVCFNPPVSVINAQSKIHKHAARHNAEQRPRRLEPLPPPHGVGNSCRPVHRESIWCSPNQNSPLHDRSCKRCLALCANLAIQSAAHAECVACKPNIVKAPLAESRFMTDISISAAIGEGAATLHFASALTMPQD